MNMRALKLNLMCFYHDGVVTITKRKFENKFIKYFISGHDGKGKGINMWVTSKVLTPLRNQYVFNSEEDFSEKWEEVEIENLH